MIPPTAVPAPINPAPATDLPVSPTSASNLSAFDPSLSSAAMANAQGASMASPAELGQHMMGTLNGYQADLSKMQTLTNSLTAGAQPTQLAMQSPAQPGAAQPQTSSPQQAGTSQGGNQPMVGLMVQTFNFAIETELVTRAATQFTGSVGTLMKGQ